MTVKKIRGNATFNIPEKVSASLDERKRNSLGYFCNIVHNLATTKTIKLITYKLPELNVCESIPSPFDSILDAVLTVSPNKQYRGIVIPTTPATTGPERNQCS